ncbi:hypothetical protein KBB76_02310 [Candidatus Saccharibacteria bacterium]|jgi:hypothetical protein|nr:hypothetical protein [Candidatus Saccharibacteria bacterium]
MDCQDKLAFDSKESAKKAALVAKYQHGVILKPYLCDLCALWHLASDFGN